MENINSPEKAALAPASSRKTFTAARFADLLTRVLPAAFFLMVVMQRIGELIVFVRAAGAKDISERGLTFYVAIGSRLSVILFLLLAVVLFVIRTPPVKKAKGIFPRVTAIVGSFLMSIVTVFPRANLGLWATVTATLLILIGTILSIFVLTQLGRSFSLMAEARRLVTSGSYSLVRHPLYLAEEIAMLGTALQFFSIFALLIFVIHLLVQIQRMKNEEAVLRQVYPEYADYQACTSRLIPGIY